MKVVYKSITEEILDAIEQSKEINQTIDHIILTEEEAWTFFMAHESILRLGEFEGFLDFKEQLKTNGFFYQSAKLKMENK